MTIFIAIKLLVTLQRYRNSLKYGWICEEFCKQLGYQADT